MKKTFVIIMGICCLSLLAPNLASAKGKKTKGSKANPEQVTAAKAILAKYDTNSSGTLDADEIATLQKDYAAGNEPDAKVFDVNNDNTLDDSEIAAIQKDASAKGGKKKKAN